MATNVMGTTNPNPAATRALSWVFAGCAAAIAIAVTITFIRYLF